MNENSTEYDTAEGWTNRWNEFASSPAAGSKRSLEHGKRYRLNRPAVWAQYSASFDVFITRGEPTPRAETEYKNWPVLMTHNTVYWLGAAYGTYNINYDAFFVPALDLGPGINREIARCDTRFKNYVRPEYY